MIQRLILLTIGMLLLQLSCCPEKKGKKETEKSNSESNIESKVTPIESKEEGIPPDGEYIYDIFFAEFPSLNDAKATVIIKGNKIKIVALKSDNKQVPFEEGFIIEEGIIMKHVSGEWIVGKSETDKNAEVIGGCTGGPNVLDFELKVYSTC